MMKSPNKNHITAKEISKRFGVSYPTLNYYTNLGFFNMIAKHGNKRFYDAREVKAKLEIINRLKNDGYPLRLIRKKIL